MYIIESSLNVTSFSIMEKVIKEEVHESEENVECPIFGEVIKYSDNGKLPDKVFVMKQTSWIRKNSRLSLKEKSNAVNFVTNYVKRVWQRCHIPSVSNMRIKQMVNKYETRI